MINIVIQLLKVYLYFSSTFSEKKNDKQDVEVFKVHQHYPLAGVVNQLRETRKF